MTGPLSSARRHAPATLRNREPLLAVLQDALPSGLALEVASGSGEHAVYFAEHLPHVQWQPTDPSEEARESIEAWRQYSAQLGRPTPLPPLALHANEWPWPVARANSIVCINMIHIAPWSAYLGLLYGAAQILPPEAPLVLYGPFQRNGSHTAPSNEAFHLDLQARNPEWGVRALEDVEDAALGAGFALTRVVPMPANNFTAVFNRGPN